MTRAWNGVAATLAAIPLLAVLALAGCSSPAGPPAGKKPGPGGPGPGRSASAAPATHDPPTAAALLQIAQAFNNDYDNGDFAAVYERWDARSQALISRAEYVRRHTVCAPATHEAAQVEGAARAGGGAWQVRYEIAGQQLVDTWYYQRRRWVFDIIASNPDAARQYRMPFAQYAAAVGCSTR